MRPTYHQMPIIAVRKVQFKQYDSFFVDCMRMWRKKTFKVKAMHMNHDKLQLLYRIASNEEWVDIERPIFLTTSVGFPFHSNKPLVTPPIEFFPVIEESCTYLGPTVSADPGNEVIELDSAERTKRLYWYQRSCKQPDMHGLACRCPAFSNFELPLQVKVNDWVEGLA